MSSPSKSLFSNLQGELGFSKYQGLGNDFLMLDGSSITGIPRWVDLEYLALEPEPGGEVLLVARQAIALIRPLPS